MKWQKLTLILMIALLSVANAPATGEEVQISTDNTTWIHINTTQYGGNIGNGYGIALGLEDGELYYVRAKNATTSWGYREVQTNLAGEKGNMILGLLLIPLGLCFFFVYLAQSLGDNHNGIKWFFRILSIIMIVPVFAAANNVLDIYPAYQSLSGVYNLDWVQAIIFTMLALFFIIIIASVFASFNNKKMDDFDKGVI